MIFAEKNISKIWIFQQLQKLQEIKKHQICLDRNPTESATRNNTAPHSGTALMNSQRWTYGNFLFSVSSLFVSDLSQPWIVNQLASLRGYLHLSKTHQIWLRRWETWKLSLDMIESKLHTTYCDVILDFARNQVCDRQRINCDDESWLCRRLRRKTLGCCGNQLRLIE